MDRRASEAGGWALPAAWGRNGPGSWDAEVEGAPFPQMTFDLFQFPSFRLRGKGLAMLHVTRGVWGSGSEYGLCALIFSVTPGPVIAGGQDGGVPQDVEPHGAPRLGPAVPRTAHPVLKEQLLRLLIQVPPVQVREPGDYESRQASRRYSPSSYENAPASRNWFLYPLCDFPFL